MPKKRAHSAAAAEAGAGLGAGDDTGGLAAAKKASMAAFVAGLPPRGGGGGVKVLCYNVNGLRGATREGERREEMLAWLAAEDPDVLCIQEVKADRAAVEKEKLAGVFPSLPHAYFACGEEDGARFKKGYAGVAVFSKEPALSCTVGLGSKAHDGEGRVLTLTFPWGTLVNVYAPNSGQALDRLGYRTEDFDPALRAHLGKLLKAEGGGGSSSSSSSSSGGGGGAAPPVLVVGDFNVAHQNCDVMGFKEHRNKIAGFCDGERDNFAALLAEGYRDLWRDANPTTLQYTYYSVRSAAARSQNKGWRVDYALASAGLKGAEVTQHSTWPHNDHLPFYITIKQ